MRILHIYVINIISEIKYSLSLQVCCSGNRISSGNFMKLSITCSGKKNSWLTDTSDLSSTDHSTPGAPSLGLGQGTCLNGQNCYCTEYTKPMRSSIFTELRHTQIQPFHTHLLCLISSEKLVLWIINQTLWKLFQLNSN